MSSNGAASGFSLLQVNPLAFFLYWCDAADRYMCIIEMAWHHGTVQRALYCPTRLLRRFEYTTSILEVPHLVLP